MAPVAPGARPRIRFSAGYQPPGQAGESFPDIVEDYRESIAEVYFPWPGMPTGRAPIGGRGAREILERDLRRLKALGVKLNLLLNAGCHGADAISRALADRVRSVVGRLAGSIGLDVVTTASPFIARVVKRAFPDIEVRASVNMRTGTVESLEYLAELFDAFHVQREYNRDLGRLTLLKTWADSRGRRLQILANSGCLPFCSGQAFHDNLVAHGKGVAAKEPADTWNPHLCWNHYRERRNWIVFLRSTWVRPEDTHGYAPLFPVMKLATRAHDNPRAVIHAYATGRFYGNLPDLLEPGHGPLFAPFIFDNARFPPDWFTRVTNPGSRAEMDAYYASVLDRVLVRADEIGRPLHPGAPVEQQRRDR